MRIPAKYTIIFPALLACALTGCGPGFPIMTREQEALVNNVDQLMAESTELKKKVSALEGDGGAGLTELRAGVEEVRRAIAGTNSSIEGLRQEFSFVQGSVEESYHKNAQLKESLGEMSGSLERLNQRLADMEAKKAGDTGAFEALKASLADTQLKLSALTESMAAFGKRTAALEERAASAAAPVLAAAEKKPAPSEAEPPETMYLRGYNKVKEKDFPAAAAVFGNFLSAYPKHKLAGNARYWLGEIYYARGDWEMAILEFDKVIKNYPDGEKAPAAVLKQGFSFEKLGSKKEARVLFEQVVDKYPDSPEAGLAKKRLEALK